MDHEPESRAVSPGSDRGLSALDAAALLRQTTVGARRQFDVWPAYLLVIGAIIFAGAYGAVWWSVHAQSPYVGPSGAALAAMYGGIVAWIVVSSTVVRRATRGVSGPSATSRMYRTWYLAVIVAYSLFQGALYHAGASHAIVYGVFPASAPWLFAGTIILTLGVVREEIRTVLFATSLIVIGVAGAFAGARVDWLVSGAGITAVLVAFALIQSAKHRA
jgi:hypothetical protein